MEQKLPKELKDQIAKTLIECVGIQPMIDTGRKLADEAETQEDMEIWLGMLAILNGEAIYENGELVYLNREIVPKDGIVNPPPPTIEDGA